ncbi:MAG TPA: hypothetical protein VFS21_25890 [Roseiflexaceae bacterium]|nr:hypothetical protein [Roseiflexaceae bacterium]
MNRAPTRRITIDGVLYLWRTADRLDRDTHPRMTLALSTFTAYRAPLKHGALVISFTTWDDPRVGNPLNTGWHLPGPQGTPELLNLHHPSLAERLIRYALAYGWNPQQNRSTLHLDGLDILTSLGYDTSSLCISGS